MLRYRKECFAGIAGFGAVTGGNGPDIRKDRAAHRLRRFKNATGRKKNKPLHAVTAGAGIG